jgi:hypothetical protein
MTVSADDICGYKQRSKYVSMVLTATVGFAGVNWFYMSRADAEYVGIGIVFLAVFLIALVMLVCGRSSTCLRGFGIALLVIIFC